MAEKVAFETQRSPRERLERALQEVSVVLHELPPKTMWSGDKPMSAFEARMVAAGYRQIAKDLDLYADRRAHEE